MPKSIRFTTAQKLYGPIRHALTVSGAEWQQAVAEGRFATVYHAENDWCTPVVAMVNHHGCCNTVCKILFTKPLPPEVDQVIGLRNNDDAWRICNRPDE